MKFPVGIGFFQFIQRMDGIGRTGQIKLNIRSFKLRIPRNGKLSQLQTEGIIHQFIFFLQRIMRGYEKPHFIQPFIFAKIIGKGKMSDVNRIEGAAEDTRFHSFVFIRFQQV